MSILTHGFERPYRSSRKQGALGSAFSAPISRVHSTTLQHLCLRALALLSMGAVLTALIALKTAIFMWRFHF
jgi:hypothetical protein